MKHTFLTRIIYVLAIVALATPLFAASLSWTGSYSSVFDDLQNWSPAQSIAAGDTLTVGAFSGYYSPEISGDINGIADFTLGDVIVNDGYSTLTMSAGDFNIQEQLTVNSYTGSTTFHMTGGTIDKLTGSNNINIGVNGGYGRLDVYGGTINNAMCMFVGAYALSSGTLDIQNGGTITTAGLRVGEAGTGTVNIAGNSSLTSTVRAVIGNYSGPNSGNATIVLGTYYGSAPDHSSLTIPGCDMGNWGNTSSVSIQLNNQTSFISTSDLLMGMDGDATIELNDGSSVSATTINACGWGNTTSFTLNGTSTFATTGDLAITPALWTGMGAGGNFNLTVNADTTCTIGGNLLNTNVATPANITVAGGTMNVTGAMQLNTAGTVIITGNGALTAGTGTHFGYLYSNVKVTLGTLGGTDPDSSTLTVQNSAAGDCEIACWGGAGAVFELNNQTSFVYDGFMLMAAGGYATINLNDSSSFSAGAIDADGWAGSLDITLNNTATFSTLGDFSISPTTWGAKAKWANITVNGGTCSVGGSLNVLDATPFTLAVNSGGVFETQSLHLVPAAVATVKFNGGTLKALKDNATLIAVDSGASCTVLVQSQGVVIDTNGKNVSVQPALQEDAESLGGGLLKIGDGTLTLEASPTYSGNTTVNAGALVLPTLNTPNATVYVATDASLTASSITASTLSIGGDPHRGAAPLPVPEPSVLVLLSALGLCGVYKMLRRK
jgi:fibronectin-binding autotransporter adhesin